jgi:hypothetical protein
VKRIPPKPGEVWPFEGDLGSRRAMQVVGSVAAPLLAGFAFALLVLVLPTLAGPTRTSQPGKPVVTTTPGEFSAHPVVAAALLAIAGVLLIFATQACFGMVVHDKRPTDLEEWYPQWFRERDPQDPNPTFPDGIGTVPGGLGPEDAGKHSYSGRARTYVYDEIRRANRWEGVALALRRGDHRAALGRDVLGLAAAR